MVPRYVHSSLNDRLNQVWRRGVRLAARVAIAFGLSTAAAIALAAAVADNAFVQIVIIGFGALAFWIPFVFLVAAVERLFRREPRSGPTEIEAESRSGGREAEPWRRLSTVAPRHSERIMVLRRSLERSREELRTADLDPEAHDLCVLIDRRLPQLIHRELENLAPDDRGRERQLRELVELIEQFARHCSRKRSGEPGTPAYEAAVLRRRFEARLSDF